MKSTAAKIVKRLPIIGNIIRKKNERGGIDERRKYVTLLYKRLLGRKPLESEVNTLVNSSYSISEILQSFLKLEEYKKKEEYQRKENLLKVDLLSMSLCQAYIVGENKPLSASRLFSWYKIVAEELANQQSKQGFLRVFSNHKTANINPLGSPVLTLITSMYKGEKYIQSFLESITNQTIFNQCQLFIVDANSPQNEYQVIKEYLEDFANIKYIRLDKVIGIYEVWNLVIKESNSEFLTNTNVDDLHRNDALELKLKALRENPEIDVVYSDVYYSFLPNLPFEIAEKGGIQTNLPTANKFNLLNFNSPHNSPMWRRSLHEKIGYFDTTYKSAGDHEFWLRAAFSGATFMKIPELVVVYYQNPNGISTQKDSPGNIEGPELVRRYRSILEL